MDNRQSFWLKQSSWPIDALGFTFLGRAMLRIGKAKFGDKWTEKEPFTDTNLRPLPIIFEFGKLHEKKAAHKLLGYEAKYRMGGRTIPKISDEDWSRAVALCDLELKGLKPARARWAAVQSLTANAFLNGKLGCYFRPKSGGAFNGPSPDEHWNTERIDQRFYWCQMNPADPFGDAVGGDKFYYIYVDDTELKKLISSILDPTSKTKPRGINAGGAKTKELRKNEQKCANWLIEKHMKPDPTNKASKTKKKLYAESVKQGFIVKSSGTKPRPNVSFNRAWKIATKDFPEWRKGSEAKRESD